MKKILVILLIVLTLLISLVVITRNVASTPTIWDGTVDTSWYNGNETEFTINTAEQLAGFAELVNNRNTFSGKSIKLGQNIMLNDTANWQNWESTPPENKWKPIKGIWSEEFNGLNRFYGTFDGNGHVISGVYINSVGGFQGLFGFTSGEIKNLGVVASYVKGDFSVGGLVGLNSYGGIISNCYFTGKTKGEKDVGGLVGSNGSYDGKGMISNSYFIGEATGKENVGGLVGNNYIGSISNSYSVGTVTGNENVGGFAGYNSSPIRNSYSAALVTGKKHIGGLTGLTTDAIYNSYYDKEASGQSESNGKHEENNEDMAVYGSDNYGGTGKTTAEMQSKEFADELNFVAGILSTNAWVYETGKYPSLSNKIAAETNVNSLFASGNGTESNPYIIENKKQLENFSWLANSGMNFSNKYLKLGAHIVLNDTANWRNWESSQPANKWTPIASFNGTFDGNGYIISGIYIKSIRGNQGFFGHIDTDGTVKRLGVTASYFKAWHRGAGGLAGENWGTINNSYFIGSVIGRYGKIGGLAGINEGTISNCYSVAPVISELSFDWAAGGITGGNDNLRLNNELHRNNSKFRLAKTNPSVINSYYEKETSKIESEYEIRGDGEEKSKAEMKQKSTFEGWDFNSIWGISSDVNGGYPYLRQSGN